MNNLVEIQKNIMSLQIDLQALNEEYEKAKSALETELTKAKGRLNAAKAGIDSARLDLAVSVLRVKGGFVESKQRADAVQSAIKQIADSETPMQRQFVGVKQYSGFGDQRCDCEYGCGPKHGGIVFAIEATERERAWTGEERDAAIYYLLNLREIQKAQAAA